MNICKLFKQTILLESKAVCFFRKFPAEGSEKIEEAENERPGKLRGSASSGGSTEGGKPFVQGYRECNIPVRVKGGSLAQRSVACDTPYWVITCLLYTSDAADD